MWSFLIEFYLQETVNIEFLARVLRGQDYLNLEDEANLVNKSYKYVLFSEN